MTVRRLQLDPETIDFPCEICREWRPITKTNVLKITYGLYVIDRNMSLDRNITYCNDRKACQIGALAIMRECEGQERVEGRDGRGTL